MAIEPMPRYHPMIKDGAWYVSDSHKGRGQATPVSPVSYADRAGALQEANRLNEELAPKS